MSYVPKKSRAVILLSSMHHDMAVSEETHKKSKATLYYNETKDDMDQMVQAYSCKRKINQCPISFFPIWLMWWKLQLFINGRRKILDGAIIRYIVNHYKIICDVWLRSGNEDKKKKKRLLQNGATRPSSFYSACNVTSYVILTFTE